MEGTVNCAKREEGRPAFAGTAATTGTAVEEGGLTTACITWTIFFDLVATGAATVFTKGFAALVASGFCATLDIGLAKAFLTALVTLGTGFTAFLATVLATGLAANFVLTTGLADFLGTAFAAGFAVLAADFAVGLTLVLTSAVFAFAGFAAGLAALLAVLAKGIAKVLGLATAALLGLTALFDLITLTGLDFTSWLLAGLARTVSLAFAALLGAFTRFADGVCTARECTGFAIPNPISCKSETIIYRSP